METCWAFIETQYPSTDIFLITIIKFWWEAIVECDGGERGLDDGIEKKPSQENNVEPIIHSP